MGGIRRRARLEQVVIPSPQSDIDAGLDPDLDPDPDQIPVPEVTHLDTLDPSELWSLWCHFMGSPQPSTNGSISA